MNKPTPIDIKLLQKTRVIEITFEDGKHFCLPCEYLRVFSPSAEVRGHGENQIKLITGKKNINIVGIEPVGNYAVKLIFDDGHNTGLYTWEMLYEFGENYSSYWQQYLQRLEAVGASRENVS